MTRLEKILGVTTALLFVLFLAHIGRMKIDSWYTQRQQQLAALDRKIDEKQVVIARGEQDAAQLTQLRRRSLPTDRNTALALYTQWLHNLLADSRLTDVQVRLQPSRASRAHYEQLALSVTCRGRMPGLVQSLYKFSRADHLHKIQSLLIKPRDDSGTLDLTFTIQAILLPGADHNDRLGSDESDRLAHDELPAYMRSLLGRNLIALAATQSPRQVESQPTASESRSDAGDAASETYFTKILANGSTAQVWLVHRTSGRTHKLSTGEPFEIGRLQGTIAHIGSREVDLDCPAGVLRLRLGDPLSDAKPLAATPSAATP